MGRSSTLSGIKTTLKYHLFPIRMDKIKIIVNVGVFVKKP